MSEVEGCVVAMFQHGQIKLPYLSKDVRFSPLNGRQVVVPTTLAKQSERLIILSFLSQFPSLRVVFERKLAKSTLIKIKIINGKYHLDTYIVTR